MRCTSFLLLSSSRLRRSSSMARDSSCCSRLWRWRSNFALSCMPCSNMSSLARMACSFRRRRCAILVCLQARRGGGVALPRAWRTICHRKHARCCCSRLQRALASKLLQVRDTCFLCTLAGDARLGGVGVPALRHPGERHGDDVEPAATPMKLPAAPVQCSAPSPLPCMPHMHRDCSLCWVHGICSGGAIAHPLSQRCRGPAFRGSRAIQKGQAGMPAGDRRGHTWAGVAKSTPPAASSQHDTHTPT